MNYFAHGLPLIDSPYALAGVSLPDWLSVVDRKVRVRRRNAVPLVGDSDPRVHELARGIVRHHDDDHWFHATAAFAELQWKFTVLVRDTLGDERGLRPSFLGHILVELLLDASLIADDRQMLAAYYEALGSISSSQVQQQAERIAGRPAPRLAEFVDIFLRVQFLYDYLDDGKLLFRLNQVMSRVRLPPLPPRFVDILPSARAEVDRRREELLTRPAELLEPTRTPVSEPPSPLDTRPS